MTKNQNKTFWQFKNISNEEVELRISGEIIDDDWAWVYEWYGISVTSPNAFRDELKKHSGQDIKVWIDSIGGSVFAGAGIYNALKEHNGKVTTIVDGKALSAASVIAMAGDEVKMSPVGIMMIHNPVGSPGWGEAKDLRQAADVLDVVKETIINAYQIKTKKPRNVISEMMDAETFLSAQKAVAEGFADSVLYTESGIDLNSVENNFMISRLDIQNSMSASTRKFIEIAQLQAGAEHSGSVENKNQEREEKIVEIKNIEDLRKAYPELTNQLETEGQIQGTKNERERIREIEAISKNIDAELVTKAKYDEIMDAKDLAYQALQADSGLAKNYLKNALEDSKNSGVDTVKAQAQTQGEDDKPKSLEDRFVNVSAKLDARRRGVN